MQRAGDDRRWCGQRACLPLASHIEWHDIEAQLAAVSALGQCWDGARLNRRQQPLLPPRRSLCCQGVCALGVCARCRLHDCASSARQAVSGSGGSSRSSSSSSSRDAQPDGVMGLPMDAGRALWRLHS